MSVPLAFLRRDFLIWASYRLAMLWQVLGIFSFICLVYFVGAALGGNAALGAGQDGGFVAFALSGIAFTDVILQALYGPPQSLRDNQKSGTLEPLLLTPTTALGVALASSLFRIVLALVRLVAYLAFGALVLGFWHRANLLTVALVVLAAWLTFAAIGILSSAFIILAKQGDPVLIAYGAVSALMSGVFFPVASLPAWLQPLARLNPLTYALDGCRQALDGASPLRVAPAALTLLVMGLAILPPAILAFNWAVNRARKEGSLAQY